VRTFSILHALASLNIVGSTLWIVQEVVLARTVSLLCGDLLFNWTDLIPIADALRADHLWMTGGWSESHLALKLSNNCATICITNRTREMLNFGQFCGEYVLGNIARSLEVSDLRDKVYSVLGFIPKPIQDKIKVDVEKTIVAVYTEFSRSLLKYGENFELLKDSGVSSSAIADLRFWCIDFSQDKKLSRVIDMMAQFQAGRNYSLLPCIQAFDGPLLTILGWKVDCINQVVQDMPYWSFEIWDTDTLEAARKCEEDCLQISRIIFNATDDVPDEHWRTITGDRDKDKKGSRREEYLEWRQSVLAMTVYYPFLNKQTDNSLVSPPMSLLSDFNEDVKSNMWWKSFYSTKGGRIGIGPREAQPGDFVCIPYQSTIPYIMRRNDANGRYKLLGETYCSSVMYGEIFDIGDELKAMEVGFVIE